MSTRNPLQNRGESEVELSSHRMTGSQMAQYEPVRFKSSYSDIKKIREQYRSDRCRHLLDNETTSLLHEHHNSETKDSLVAATTERWRTQAEENLFSARNLPPLINKNAVDPVLKRNMILISEVCGNIGSVCFIVGSIYFYPQYEEACGRLNCVDVGAILFILGSFLFFVGAIANFIKNDAGSMHDLPLTVNASLYIFANGLFTVGSFLFLTSISGIVLGPDFILEDIGIILFIVGSGVFIVAPIYDMYRAYLLRGSNQISYFSLVVEILVAGNYIGGSILFFVASFYFIPSLYEYFAVTMFVVGSCCFQFACIVSPLANLYRYMNRVRQLNALKRQESELKSKSKGGVLDAGFGDVAISNGVESTKSKKLTRATIQGSQHIVTTQSAQTIEDYHFAEGRPRRVTDVIEFC